MNMKLSKLLILISIQVLLISCFESGSGSTQTEIPSIKMNCTQSGIANCTSSSLESIDTTFIIFNGTSCADYFEVSNSAERVFIRKTTQTSFCSSTSCNAEYAGNYATFFSETTDQIEIGDFNIAIVVNHNTADGATPAADSSSANPTTDVILCREGVNISQSSTVISMDDLDSI